MAEITVSEPTCRYYFDTTEPYHLSCRPHYVEKRTVTYEAWA